MDSELTTNPVNNNNISSAPHIDLTTLTAFISSLKSDDNELINNNLIHLIETINSFELSERKSILAPLVECFNQLSMEEKIRAFKFIGISGCASLSLVLLKAEPTILISTIGWLLNQLQIKQTKTLCLLLELNRSLDPMIEPQEYVDLSTDQALMDTVVLINGLSMSMKEYTNETVLKLIYSVANVKYESFENEIKELVLKSKRNQSVAELTYLSNLFAQTSYPYEESIKEEFNTLISGKDIKIIAPNLYYAYVFKQLTSVFKSHETQELMAEINQNEDVQTIKAALDQKYKTKNVLHFLHDNYIKKQFPKCLQLTKTLVLNALSKLSDPGLKFYITSQYAMWKVLKSEGFTLLDNKDKRIISWLNFLDKSALFLYKSNCILTYEYLKSSKQSVQYSIFDFCKDMLNRINPMHYTYLWVSYQTASMSTNYTLNSQPNAHFNDSNVIISPDWGIQSQFAKKLFKRVTSNPFVKKDMLIALAYAPYILSAGKTNLEHFTQLNHYIKHYLNTKLHGSTPENINWLLFFLKSGIKHTKSLTISQNPKITLTPPINFEKTCFEDIINCIETQELSNLILLNILENKVDYNTLTFINNLAFLTIKEKIKLLPQNVLNLLYQMLIQYQKGVLTQTPLSLYVNIDYEHYDNLSKILRLISLSPEFLSPCMALIASRTEDKNLIEKPYNGFAFPSIFTKHPFSPSLSVAKLGIYDLNFAQFIIEQIARNATFQTETINALYQGKWIISDCLYPNGKKDYTNMILCAIFLVHPNLMNIFHEIFAYRLPYYAPINPIFIESLEVVEIFDENEIDFLSASISRAQTLRDLKFYHMDTSGFVQNFSSNKHIEKISLLACKLDTNLVKSYLKMNVKILNMEPKTNQQYVPAITLDNETFDELYNKIRTSNQPLGALSLSQIYLTPAQSSKIVLLLKENPSLSLVSFSELNFTPLLSENLITDCFQYGLKSLVYNSPPLRIHQICANFLQVCQSIGDNYIYKQHFIKSFSFALFQAEKDYISNILRHVESTQAGVKEISKDNLVNAMLLLCLQHSELIQMVYHALASESLPGVRTVLPSYITQINLSISNIDAKNCDFINASINAAIYLEKLNIYDTSFLNLNINILSLISLKRLGLIGCKLFPKKFLNILASIEHSPSIEELHVQPGVSSTQITNIADDTLTLQLCEIMLSDHNHLKFLLITQFDFNAEQIKLLIEAFTKSPHMEDLYIGSNGLHSQYLNEIINDISNHANVSIFVHTYPYQTCPYSLSFKRSEIAPKFSNFDTQMTPTLESFMASPTFDPLDDQDFHKFFETEEIPKKGLINASRLSSLSNEDNVLECEENNMDTSTPRSLNSPRP